MSVTKYLPVRATMAVTESTLSVTAVYTENGTELVSDLVSSHITVRNTSIGPVEHKLNAGDWETLKQGSNVRINANMAVDTVVFRKARFPTTADAAALFVSIYGFAEALLLGDGGGDGTEDRTFTLPVPPNTYMVEGELRWEDLRFPAQGINPAGAASPPSVDETLTSLSGTLLFSGSQENVIAGVAQMPHAWKRGSELRPHIHWSKPVGSSAAVAWEFYYRHLGFAGDVAGAWVGPVAHTITSGSPTVTNEHVISTFGTISMTGRRESCMLCWQIRRQGNTDADNGTARLYEFDIHYQADKNGTPDEIPAA